MVKRGVVEHDVGRVRSDELDTGANMGQPAVHWTVDGHSAGDAQGGKSSVADGIAG